MKIKATIGDRRLIIYLLSFLFSLSITPAIYINSSFLEQFVGSSNVGYIYTIASALTLISLVVVRKFLNRFGNYLVFLFSVIVTALSYLILSLDLIIKSNKISGLIFVIVFMIAFVFQNLAFFNLDIFLENITKNKETGGIRGLFLTAMNLAFIVGPLIAGLMVPNINEAGKVYALGSIILLPVIFIARRYFYNFEDPEYKKSALWKTALKVKKNINLYRIFVSNLILRLFFSWMVIYTPLFLHQVMGFDLGSITIIIGFALIPFILLEAPLGKIADTKFGEKEILTIGFLITAISTGLISFIISQSIIVWIGILFMTRVGASMIEIMTETHLFKKIDDEDIDTMGLYRAVRPLAYIIGPIIASFLLIFINIQYIFIVFGAVVLFGIRYSSRLKDTL